MADGALAMDGWDKDDTLDIWREHDGSNTKEGSFYATKLTSPSGTLGIQWPHGSLTSNETHYTRFQGRTVTFGLWVKTSISTARIWIYDGSSSYSAYHTGGGGYEWLEKTITFSTSITTLTFSLQIQAGTAYISQPMLVFGNSIGSGNYTRPQGEVVWLENYDDLTDYTGAAISSNVTINLEAQSNGVIPKGAKAVYCNVAGQASALDAELVLAQSTDANERGTWMIAAVATPRYVSASGWVPCDSNGDIGVWQSAAWADARIRVTGVELR